MLKRFVVHVTLMFIGLALAVAVAEVVLRLIGINNPVFYVPDSITGYALRPNAEGWWIKEGREYVRINSAGLRDVDHQLEKREGVFRIAILGDSYAEALQVPLERAFWKVLETGLSGCRRGPARQVEVINFGVSGYGTAQEWLTWQSRVRVYSPDLVVLAFVTGNDVRNNLRALELDPVRPYFVRNEADLVVDNSFRETFLFRVSMLVSPIMEYSRVLQLANVARVRVKQWYRAYAHQQPITELEGEEPGLDSAIYLEPHDPHWQEAWVVTEQLLRKIAKDLKAAGTQLLVVSLSNGIQVHPDRAVRERFKARLGVNNLFYPESRLDTLGRAVGFRYIALAPAMQRAAEEKGLFFHGFDVTKPGFGHWNELGHRYAGEHLARELCAHRD